MPADPTPTPGSAGDRTLPALAAEGTGPGTGSDSGTALPQPSDLSDRYRVEDRIGEGGMGFVVRAFDRYFGRKVALKIAHPDASVPAEEFARRFFVEAQITGQLEHPNIVPVHDLGFDRDGFFYFSMKRIDGVTLAHRIDEVREGTAGVKDWSVTRALHVFLKVCDAVSFAHSLGVLHRDLKPANVMIGRFGEVMVMDWGLAKVARPAGAEATAKGAAPPPAVPVPASTAASEDGAESPSDRVRALTHAHTQVGTVLGTLRYMPPEQALGLIDQLDERSDLYSLGAVLYEMATLLPPFDASSGASLQVDVVRGDLVPPRARVRQGRVEGKLKPGVPAELPPELEAIILRAMALEPGDRYPSVEALRSDVLHFLEGLPVSAYPEGPTRKLVKWLRRHPAVLATATTAGLLLVGVGAAAFLVLRAQERERFALLEEKVCAEQTAAAEARRRMEAAEAQRLREAARAEAYRHYLDAERARQLRLPGDQVVGGLQEALRCDPDFAQAWIDLGFAWLATGRPTEAVEAFRKAGDLYGEQRESGLQARALFHAGQTYADHLGKPDSALEVYERAAQVAPEEPFGHLGRAQVLARKLQFESALEQAQKAAARFQNLWEVHSVVAYLRGQKRVGLGGAPNPLYDPALAIQSLDKAISLHPRGASLWCNRAVVLLETGRLAEAEADVRRALDADPNWGHAYQLAGVIHRRQNRLQDALRSYTRALELSPTAETWFNRGFVLTALGRGKEAVADFDRFLEQVPGNHAGLVRRGVARIVAQDSDGARGDFETVVKADARGLGAVALATLDAGAFPFAVEYADRQLQAEPRNAEALRIRGLARLALGDEPAADADLERGAALVSDPAEWWGIAGRFALERGRGEVAARFLDRGLALDPGRAAILAWRGFCDLIGNRLPAAEAWFEKALLREPAEPVALHGRGLCRLERGDGPAGEQDFAAAHRAGSGVSDFVALTVYLRLGELHIRQRHVTQALSDYDRALLIAPDSIRGHAGRGRALFELGRLEEAEPHLTRALEGGEARAIFSLAGIRVRQRRLDEARALLRDAARNPDLRADAERLLGTKELAEPNDPKGK